VLDQLDVRSGDVVLEVGYGPGGLVRLLSRRTTADRIQGVDPSAEMRDAATRLNRGAVRQGRVELRQGSADRTGLPDQSVDRVVTVNNVALWPDLDAGLDELHRVLRPGGVVVIGWHGGAAPSRIARKLRLPEDKLTRIATALDERFAEVTRHQLKQLDVFRAVRDS
jgi:ubiquinone/menaquinone biosynthesis C-methylase UbiE